MDTKNACVQQFLVDSRACEESLYWCLLLCTKTEMLITSESERIQLSRNKFSGQETPKMIGRLIGGKISRPQAFFSNPRTYLRSLQFQLPDSFIPCGHLKTQRKIPHNPWPKTSVLAHWKRKKRIIITVFLRLKPRINPAVKFEEIQLMPVSNSHFFFSFQFIRDS